jgi:hypothetical protein
MVGKISESSTYIVFLIGYFVGQAVRAGFIANYITTFEIDQSFTLRSLRIPALWFWKSMEFCFFSRSRELSYFFPPAP